MSTGSPSQTLPQTIEWLSPKHVEILNALPARRSIEMVLELWEMGWSLVEANVRFEHKDWTDQQVHSAVVARMNSRASA